MRIKLRSVILLVIVVLMITTSTAFAGTGTITLTGGSLTLTSGNIDMGTVVLNAYGQLISGVRPAAPWRVVDGMGTGSGWHVTMASTNWHRADATADWDIKNGSFLVKLAPEDISAVDGSGTNVTSSQVSYVGLSTTKTILTAGTGAGMGTYAFTPQFQLFVPISALAGTYTATITTTVIAGP